ncbi:TPA: S-type pyocin domain-containing protein [Klebsiella michiganensis]|uniref:S-type pyocin domain-containing protein n=1 Tax=Klebsiella michiganensis TaxID=1134687 RepID=UPI000D54AB6F|nr:S-type pyocin domain-containing protein [Klebsiella michiganensis]AWF56215.1 colicin-D [Klebsiella michiganensis]MDU7883565.1 S-type pyocin domain-containing protein [Klebsiella michiganensis]
MDEYDYNNGVPPVTGNVWLPADEDGPGRWVAPTSGSWNGDTLTVTPSGGSSAGQDGMAYGGGSYGKTPSRLQAESSAAIHATAKWSTENLKKTQAAQAERVRATMAAQQAAKASQDKLRQKLTDVTNAAIQKGREGPSVTDVAHQTIKEMEAFAQMVAQNEAVKRAEKEARKAEEAYQAALRAEEEARRQQAEIERKLKEAREREAAAKAKALADKAAAEKAEADRKALFAKAGIQDTPVYTAGMVKAANATLSAGGSMALSRAPGMIQLSASGVGTFPFNSGLAGWEASALWRGVDVLARIAPVVSAVATVLTLVRAALDIPAAGEGSDRVPGRDIDMLAAQASLYTAMKTNIQPGMKTVDLPVRGYISDDGNGRQSVNLVRTGTGGISATVPVLNAVRDKTTGLDKITVPAVAGAPSRTILINPVPVGPAAPSHTGSSTPVPVTPVHTGTDVKQADSIVTTTLPAADIPALQDFIYWQPDAAGTGVEPIYVMLSDPLDSGKYTRRQLQKKYRHVVDFGISDTKINSETLAKFRDAIEAHLSDKNTKEKGAYIR